MVCNTEEYWVDGVQHCKTGPAIVNGSGNKNGFLGHSVNDIFNIKNLFNSFKNWVSDRIYKD